MNLGRPPASDGGGGGGGNSTDRTQLWVRMIWVSSFLAAIFALPALGIFFAIYYWLDNLVAGAIAGFGLHFVTLAFSPRISRFVTRLVG